jgi:hypothetical protein
LFVTSVVYTGCKFATSVIDFGGNLPPVSTTLANLVANMLPVFDTGNNFAAGVVDTGGAP